MCYLGHGYPIVLTYLFCVHIAAGTEQYGRQATTNHSNQQPGGMSYDT